MEVEEDPAVTKFREAISRYGREVATDGRTNARQLAGFISGYMFCAQDHQHAISLRAILDYADRVMARLVVDATVETSGGPPIELHEIALSMLTALDYGTDIEPSSYFHTQLKTLLAVKTEGSQHES